MMLTTKARYAVMAMVDIALLEAERGARPVKLGEIAERQDIALNYLEQIFSKLKSCGLVNSVKGPGGGYIVARGAVNTTIADIVAAVDESVEMTRCGSDREQNHKQGCMPGGNKCITHDVWEGLTNHIRSYLDSITLADLVEKGRARKYDFIQ